MWHGETTGRDTAWGADVRAAARAYVKRGWQKTRIGEDAIDATFTPGSNIGLLLGSASDGLVDVDLDTREAQIAAETFLPFTPMRLGRADGIAQGRYTHHFYHLKGLVANTTPTGVAGVAPHTTSIAEIHADGCQTMVPPSIHPSGDALCWAG